MKGSGVLCRVALSGIGAVLVYVATTILGGILRPHYSHVSEDISKLTEAGGVHRWPLAFMYGTYNLFLARFAMALFQTSPRSRPFKVGAGLVVMNALSGILQVTWFCRDPDGAPSTFSGKGHLTAAGVSALCTVIGSLTLGFAFRHNRLWRPLSGFSLIVGAAIPISGAVTSISVLRRSRFMGLLERVTIGLSLLWVFTLSVYALLRAREEPWMELEGYSNEYDEFQTSALVG
jgi:uncharacterized protein DUF998